MAGYIGNQPLTPTTYDTRSWLGSEISADTVYFSYTPNFVEVHLNGVLLEKSDYTASSGDSITLGFTPASTDVVRVVAYGAFEIADTYTQAEIDNKYGSEGRTQSSTDTTAGRLLKVGDFGIAGYSPAITSSADNYELPGYNIWLNSASTEKPSWAGSGILLPLPAANAVTNSQFFIASAITDTKTPSLNIRQKNAVTGDWNDWQEVYHTGNTVGTVSQSGGVPTGAIIERGSNANGEYVKYADGTMICFFESLTNIITSTKVGYIYSNSPSTSFNFPVTFSATPRVSPAGRYTSGGSTASLFIRNVSTTVVTLHAYSHANNGEVTPGYTAIGRWY